MRIAAFGATGKTGQAFVEQALAAGHEVQALARTPDKLAARASLTIVPGAMDDAAAVARTLAGASAVACALGVVNRKPNTELSDATAGILAAMDKAGVARSVWVTSIGCGGSLRKLRSFVFRELIVKRLARPIWADKDRQEALIQSSRGEWTILRPGGLTDEPGTGKARLIDGDGDQPPRVRVSRADVAAAMLRALTDQGMARKTYCIFD
jgi:putative NADH-flavin reductase